MAIAAGREPALMAAALRRLARIAPLPDRGFGLRFASEVPGEVGLAGSSALVVAALRALDAAFGVGLGPDELAAAALEAETEELGIAAGPQDRVVQAHGGLVMMDFAPPSGAPWSVEPLDPGLLPPLFVAWRRDTATHSGDYHRELRRRHAEGDPALHGCMGRLAALASAARDALLAGDAAEFGRCLDGSFDERRSMGPLEPEHVAMIELARSSRRERELRRARAGRSWECCRPALRRPTCAPVSSARPAPCWCRCRVTRRTPPLSPA